MPKDWGWEINAHDQSTLLYKQHKEAYVSLGVCGWNFVWEKVWENFPPDKDLCSNFSSQGFNTFLKSRL